jgi:hypothetical protein
MLMQSLVIRALVDVIDQKTLQMHHVIAWQIVLYRSSLILC